MNLVKSDQISRNMDVGNDGHGLSSEDDGIKSAQSGIKGSSSGPSKERKLLLMLSCLYLQYSCWGMTIALGVIYVQLIDAFDAPRSEAALIQSMYMGVSLGGGIFFTRIIRRFDVGKCVIIAAIIGTLCLITSAFAWDLKMIIVLVGFVLGLSQSCDFLASNAVINWTFTTFRRSALGLLTIGQAVAQLSVPFITEALVERYNWNGTFLILSALMTFQCIPLGILMCLSKRYFNNDVKKSAHSENETVSMYRDIPFIIYLIGHMLFASFGPVEQWFTVDLAVMKGFTTSEGAALLSVNGICGLIGRMSGTTILHTFSALGPNVPLALSVLLWGLSHSWIINCNVLWLMTVAMIFRGLAVGHVAAFLPALQIELRGVQKYPQTMAFAAFLAGVTQILGGFLSGYSADVTGGYNLIYYLATGLAVCSSVCIMIAFAVRKRKDRQQGYVRIE